MFVFPFSLAQLAPVTTSTANLSTTNPVVVGATGIVASSVAVNNTASVKKRKKPQPKKYNPVSAASLGNEMKFKENIVMKNSLDLFPSIVADQAGLQTMSSSRRRSAAQPNQSDKEKKYICQFCDFRSTSNYNVTTHVKSVHCKIKEFACNFCDFRSAKKWNLKVNTNNFPSQFLIEINFFIKFYFSLTSKVSTRK